MALAAGAGLVLATAAEAQQRGPRHGPVKHGTAKQTPAKPGRGGAAAPKAAAAAPAPPPAPEEPPPPYEREMLRLSEIMGSLSFLRGLCSAPDAPEWQKRMNALLDAEATSPARRERLAGAFNKGYRGFALTYRHCTPSANVAIERYLGEGQALARAISTRFGG